MSQQASPSPHSCQKMRGGRSLCATDKQPPLALCCQPESNFPYHASLKCRLHGHLDHPGVVRATVGLLLKGTSAMSLENMGGANAPVGRGQGEAEPAEVTAWLLNPHERRGHQPGPTTTKRSSFPEPSKYPPLPPPVHTPPLDSSALLPVSTVAPSLPLSHNPTGGGCSPL